MTELLPLIKATTTLVQLWTVYLTLTWGYQLLMWFANSIKDAIT